ncbi:MAG: hypothetical protein ACTSQK_05245 [Candidatus Heimdallarchaeota archaeon]
MAQKVFVTTNLTPNILMHVFSCLEVEGSFYDSEYGMKHHFTLLDEDYEEWNNHAKKCMTLGCNAELYAVLFQIPSFIPTEDVDMIIDSFDKISEAIAEGSIDALITSYPELFDTLSIYAPKKIFDNHFKKLNTHNDTIQEVIAIFKKILRGVWERFYSEYWEKEGKIKLEKRAKHLNTIISPINIISAWQKVLKLEFPYSEFSAVLVEPTNTIATNLLAEQVMISLKTEDKDVYRILAHEVGRSFLLNTSLFENEQIKTLADSNIDRLSMIIDAACIHIKGSLFDTLRIRTDDLDPYVVPGLKEVIDIFGAIWDAMDAKNIFEAITQTYNKLSPIA